ncbi:hypothetical protein CR513_03051, partial [Mucuna pruriens]
MEKQEPKPRLDRSWKKEAFEKEAPNSCGLHLHSCKASILELKHEQLKSPEISSEIKIKKMVEGIKKIKQMLQLLIKKMSIAAAIVAGRSSDDTQQSTHSGTVLCCGRNCGSVKR